VIEDKEVRDSIWAFLDDAHIEVVSQLMNGKLGRSLERFKSKSGDVNNILDALGSLCAISGTLDPPMWLEGREWPRPANEYLPVANGLLHVPTGKLSAPTSQFFSTAGSDVHYIPDALDAPRWSQFLDEVFGDDAEGMATLKEIFGYCLTPNTSLQKIFMLIGPKRGGKGTIGRVLRALLGNDSVAAPTLHSISTQFGLQSLIGKPLGIISDARFSKRSDPATMAERLLTISGEDAISVPRKFKENWVGRLPTRFLILTNELPNISDSSGALLGRFIILQLTNSFFGKEDPLLFDKLEAELPGILNWSLEGYRSLKDRGFFKQPKSSEDTLCAMEALSSPIKVFVDDTCVRGPNFEISKPRLFEKWQYWCDQRGIWPGTDATFNKDLRAAFPELRESKRRGAGGGRTRVLIGITLG